MAEGDPPQTPDLAVRAFIGLFVLGAVLHGFDVMKDGMKAAVTWWGIAGGLALFDWYWVKIKGWFGPRFAAKANDVATDFRWWACALIAVFLSRQSRNQRGDSMVRRCQSCREPDDGVAHRAL